MMKKLYFLFFALFIAASAFAQRPLITKWNAADGNIKIPTVGSYTFTFRKVDNPAISGSGVGLSGETVINFPSAGLYFVEITPDSIFRFDMGNANTIDADELIELTQWGDVTWNTDLSSMFAFCYNFNISATDIPDFSQVTNMSSMFNSSRSLNSNLNGWNTSAVTNMSNMFSGTLTFNGDISPWDTSKVENFSYMFNSSAFNGDLSQWNTSSAKNMSSMFRNAVNFNGDISLWNTGLVNTFWNMFNNADSFNADIGNWNTSSATNFAGMFANTDIFNQDLSRWDTSKVTSMAGMFSNATQFNSPINNWNTEKVLTMENMFYKAINFNQYINSWNTLNVLNMRSMFADAANFNQDISSWNISNVEIMESVFNRALLFNQNLKNWDTSKVTTMNNMFSGASQFNQSLDSWNLRSAGVSMQNMLDNSGMDCENYSRTLKGWAQNPTTPSNVTLGATGRVYGTEAQQYRTTLDIDKGWTISGDAYDAGCTVSLATGEIKNPSSRLNVYPVPTTGVFFLESAAAGTARLYNGAGQEVRSFQVIKGKNTLNISSLPAGMYVITAEGQSARILKN